MAPERSVSAMRAMFEAKGENTSPPSRGRSPAGSERSNGSRNVSTMRSSFVAVEKSGMLGLRRVSDAEPPADGVSPSQRGRNPLSRTHSLSEVQEEEGGLGNILKGSPFEDARSKGRTEKTAPRSVLEQTKNESKPTEKKVDEAQPASIAKTAGLAQGTVNKFKSTAPLRDQKSQDQKPLAISTKASVPKEKITSTPARTPTSATRSGPALKVSPPSTTSAPASKPAPRKPTEPQGPKLSSRPSRPSLAAGTTKEMRAKSPVKPAAPKTSESANLRNKPSRVSLGNEAAFSRLSRPTQSSAVKTEKEPNPEEKRPRQSSSKAPDEGLLNRLTRPTQAFASKHTESPEPQAAAPAKATSGTTSSNVLDRLMKPTQSSSKKHEKEVKETEAKKTRTSLGGKPAEPGFLERMSKPTAASLNKNHEKSATTVDDRKHASPTPPRTKTQIAAAAILKPKQKLEFMKAKVEEKVKGGPKSGSSEHTEPPLGVIAPGVAPEQTQTEVESKHPTYVLVETEKADGSPHVSATAAAKVKEDAARAKRAAPVLAKEESREKALDAATPSSNETSSAANGAATKPAESDPVDEEAAAAIATKAQKSQEPKEKSATAEKVEEPSIKASDHAVQPTTSSTNTVSNQTTATKPAETTIDPAPAKSDPVNVAPEPAPATAEPTAETTAKDATISEPAQPAPEAAAKQTLASQDTIIEPPADNTSAGAGEAPGPALNAGSEVIQEAKAEALREQKAREGEALPTDSLADAVAHVP